MESVTKAFLLIPHEALQAFVSPKGLRFAFSFDDEE